MLKESSSLLLFYKQWNEQQLRCILKHVLVYSSAYALVLLASSLHASTALVVNSALIVYVLFFATKATADSSPVSSSSSNTSRFDTQMYVVHVYMLVIAVGNYCVFFLMVNSYAELLPWELGFHALFHVISAFYMISSRRPSDRSDACSKRSFFQ